VLVEDAVEPPWHLIGERAVAQRVAS
jgi:hypothetical protein